MSEFGMLRENVCPIWGTPASTHRSHAFAWHVNSPRAGGSFTIDALTYTQHALGEPLKAKLSTWIVDQHRAGIDWPALNASVIEMVEARRPLRLSERYERFFMYLSKERFRPGSRISLIEQDRAWQELAAWTECESREELLALLGILADGGLLSIAYGQISLAPVGFDRLDAVETQTGEGRQAFVAMWFDASTGPAYRDGIAPGIVDAGFIPFRIDEKEHANKIDDEIVAEIRRSRFVVADFTCPLIDSAGDRKVPNVRGGVYYEAGFAQGLGIPVIWTVRADCIEHVHFDTRQFAHIVWHEPADLRVSLTNRIRAVLGQGGGQ